MTVTWRTSQRICSVPDHTDTAEFCNGSALLAGSSIRRSVGWLKPSQSRKSLSRSPNVVQVPRQKPLKHRVFLTTLAMVVLHYMPVEVPILA
jgi:hypothetical protein